MRWLFILLIAALAASDILGLDMSLGHGLSVKNSMLYLIALALFFRLALSGAFRMRLPVIHACFAVWIAYSVVTWLAAVLVIHYHGYYAIHSAMALKSELIDPALFFFTVFYGVQEETDITAVMKALLIAVSIANIATITDVMGLTGFGVQVGTTGAEADRVFGVFGHANDTGALIVCLLPATVAAAMSSRGPARLLWYAGAAASLVVLILTVSRGAFVGLVVGYGIAVLVCRRFLPLSRVAGGVLIGLTVAVVLVGVTSLAVPHVGNVVADRVFGQSSAIDVSEASSGRTTIWASAIARMMSTPLTLFTGFGWDVYSSMPFVYVTHNYYLDLWFNLGLVGVAVFVIILWHAITTAQRAADVGTAQTRRYMIAFTFGILALAMSIFFANLTKPWAYIWMYIGASLSAAVFALDAAAEERSRAGGPERPLAPAPQIVSRGTRREVARPLARQP
jgi:O-antigen ligase